MSCIAGVGGNVPSLVRKATEALEAGRTVVAIDGCVLSCCLAALKQRTSMRSRRRGCMGSWWSGCRSWRLGGVGVDVVGGVGVRCGVSAVRSACGAALQRLGSATRERRVHGVGHIAIVEARGLVPLGRRLLGVLLPLRRCAGAVSPDLGCVTAAPVRLLTPPTLSRYWLAEQAAFHRERSQAGWAGQVRCSHLYRPAFNPSIFDDTCKMSNRYRYTSQKHSSTQTPT